MLVCLFFPALAQACDPILESLILSKDRTQRIDHDFKSLSTALRALGTHYKKFKNFEKPLLIEVQTAWLVLYRGFYLHPPPGIKSVEKWRKEMDQIGHSLGGLRKNIEHSQTNMAHKSILHLQTLLINLYGTTLSKPSFFRQNKILESLTSLFLRSRNANLEEDMQVLKQRLEKVWSKHYDLLASSSRKGLSQEEWKNKLLTFLNMSREEFEEAGPEFFTALARQYWEEMGKEEEESKKSGERKEEP